MPQTRPYDFYARQYERFNAPLAAEIRAEIYGEDIGQQGWRSMREQDEIIALVTNAPGFHMADIACGSAGPSLSIAANTDIHLTGIDMESHAIAEAERRAEQRGCADRTDFIVADCSKTLPLEDERFDLITCIDAILHLGDRTARLNDWARTLKPGGTLFLTDAAILTGAVSKAELDIRASQGAFTFAAPGVNEIAIANAGLQLIDTRDTQSAQEAAVMPDVVFDDATVDSQVVILRSERIAEAVIDRLALMEDPLFDNSGGNVLTLAANAVGALVDYAGGAAGAGGEPATGPAALGADPLALIRGDAGGEARRRAAVAKLRMGDPREESTFIGPMIDEDAAKRVERWIADMESKGIDGQALIEQAKGLIEKHGG